MSMYSLIIHYFQVCFAALLHMKGLIPKGAKSTFDQNQLINITLFSLPPTFMTHF